MVRVEGRFATFYPPPGAAALIGDFTDWKRRPLPIEGPLTLELPLDAYVEYAFLDEKGRPFADPEAPRPAENPWWPYARALTTGNWRYEALPGKPVPRERLLGERVFSEPFFSERKVWIYEPESPAKVVLLVQDGVAFLRLGRMAEVAEALIERGAIHPVRIVFLAPEDRDREYRMDPRYQSFVFDEVLPRYGGGLPFGFWGASLGGLAALWLWSLAPEGSFATAHSPALKAVPGGADAYEEPEWFSDRLLPKEGRVYLEVGVLEWLLAPTRRLAGRLYDLGVLHAYRERPSGHNWVTWWQGIAPGLRYLLGRDLEF